MKRKKPLRAPPSVASIGVAALLLYREKSVMSGAFLYKLLQFGENLKKFGERERNQGRRRWAAKVKIIL